MDMDPGFGHWLAGFTDGEGCFQVYDQPHTDKQLNFAFRCHFSITLRRDDEPILVEIQRRTGFGKVVRTQPNRGHPAARWQVSSKSSCAGLVLIFDDYPLRAKKAADYAIWRRAVSAWQRTKKGGNHRGLTDYSEMAACARALKELRAYDAKVVPLSPSPQSELRPLLTLDPLVSFKAG